jgi:hypothetical protein
MTKRKLRSSVPAAGCWFVDTQNSHSALLLVVHFNSPGGVGETVAYLDGAGVR